MGNILFFLFCKYLNAQNLSKKKNHEEELWINKLTEKNLQ